MLRQAVVGCVITECSVVCEVMSPGHGPLSHEMFGCVTSVLSDRTCPASLCSDEEIDFEQYSSGYSSAEVSSKLLHLPQHPIFHPLQLAGQLCVCVKKKCFVAIHV